MYLPLTLTKQSNTLIRSTLFSSGNYTDKNSITSTTSPKTVLSTASRMILPFSPLLTKVLKTRLSEPI